MVMLLINADVFKHSGMYWMNSDVFKHSEMYFMNSDVFKYTGMYWMNSDVFKHARMYLMNSDVFNNVFNKMKTKSLKKIHCGNSSKTNQKIVESGNFDTPNKHIHDCLLSWFDTGT